MTFWWKTKYFKLYVTCSVKSDRPHIPFFPTCSFFFLLVVLKLIRQKFPVTKKIQSPLSEVVTALHTVTKY